MEQVGSARTLVSKPGFVFQGEKEPGRGLSGRVAAQLDLFFLQHSLEEDWGVSGRRESTEEPYESPLVR